jgi:hypothetical protein
MSISFLPYFSTLKSQAIGRSETYASILHGHGCENHNSKKVYKILTRPVLFYGGETRTKGEEHNPLIFESMASRTTQRLNTKNGQPIRR